MSAMISATYGRHWCRIISFNEKSSCYVFFYLKFVYKNIFELYKILISSSFWFLECFFFVCFFKGIDRFIKFP